MQLLITSLNYIVSFAVLITIVRMYFTVNKLWKRKSDVEVAHSISLFAYFLAICVHLPFMLKFILIDKNYMTAANDLVNIVGYSITILIGTGFWVRQNRWIKFGDLIRRALRLERNEAGHLAKSFLRPKGAHQILSILEKVAYLDNTLNDKEKKLITEFAKFWKLDLPTFEDWEIAAKTTMLEVRQCIEDYLEVSPPIEQVAELLDIITLIIKSDDIVTLEEHMLLEEVTSMINSYVKNTNVKKMHYILLVPQSEEQFDSVRDIFPDASLENRRGGRVFIRGQFFSKEFAEEVCKKYIALGIFSISEEAES
jgi:hypothetical protein